MAGSAAANVLELILKGAAKGGPDVENAVRSLGVLDALNKGVLDQKWLDNALRSADEPTRKLLQNSPELKKALDELASKQGFMNEFTAAFKKASRTGQDIDLDAMLKKHGINEQDEIALSAKEAIEKTAAKERGLRTDARTKKWGGGGAYEMLDAQARHTDNKAGKAFLRSAAETKRWVLSKQGILAISGAYFATHLMTDGKSSEMAGAAAKEIGTEAYDALEQVAPELATAIKNKMPDIAHGAFTLVELPMDALEKGLIGAGLESQTAHAAASIIYQHPLVFLAEATTGEDLSGTAMTARLQEAQDYEGGVDAYLANYFGVPVEKVPALRQKIEDMRAGNQNISQENLDIFLASLKETPEAALQNATEAAGNARENFMRSAFEEAVDEYGYVGAITFTTLRFVIGTGAAGVIANIAEIVLGSWIDPIINWLSPSFNDASEINNPRYNRNITPSGLGMDDERTHVAQSSVAQPTNLRLQTPAPETG